MVTLCWYQQSIKKDGETEFRCLKDMDLYKAKEACYMIPKAYVLDNEGIILYKNK